MTEIPDKITIREQADFLVNIDEVAIVVNDIIDYLETHTLPQEVKSWAFPFLGNTANIRCTKEINIINVFRGDERFEFTLPEPKV